MTAIDLGLFGELSVTVAGRQVGGFPTAKSQALLAYLALEPERAHSRSVLAGMLWPETSERQARDNLRNTLYRLRHALDAAAPGTADHLFTVNRHTIGFNIARANVDVLVFLDRVNTVATHSHASLVDCPPCLAALHEAAELYQGELLRGLSLPDATGFEEWLLLKRENLHHRGIWLLLQLAALHEAAGDLAKARAAVVHLLTLDPYLEEAHRRMMRLLAREGLTDQALTQFADLRSLLQTELGVEPSEETARLALQIAQGEFRNTHYPSRPQRDPLQAPHSDWAEVPVVDSFFGRRAEAAQLEQWLIHDRCQMVALLGMGGMGKSTLAAHTVRSLARQFDMVVWRSLFNAPPLEEWLTAVLRSLTDRPTVDESARLDDRLALLLDFLRRRRCLLVIEDVEMILEPDQAGRFRPGYEAYEQLFRTLGCHEHQSCLLLTSRERPRAIARLERESNRVHSLTVAGLDPEAGRGVLQTHGLIAPKTAATVLVQRYSGNPLALNLVARTIEDFFDGDVDAYLAGETPIFDDIRDVLDQQIGRLSALEHDLLTWLALARSPLTLTALHAFLVDAPPQHELLQALRALKRRSLLDGNDQGFVLQNVVTEYLTDRLVAQVSQEIASGLPRQQAFSAETPVLNGFALLHAQARDYICQSQARIILDPIGQRLAEDLGGNAAIAAACRGWLDDLRVSGRGRSGYAAGNILNLLLHMGIDVTGFDFSQLRVEQACLQGRRLPAVDFSQADLSQSAFTASFGLIWTVAYSPDGRYLAAGSGDGKVQVWQADTGQLVAMWRAHDDAVYCVAFSPDGSMLASGGADGVIGLWDMSGQSAPASYDVSGSGVTGGHRLGTLVGHSGAVEQVAFRPAADHPDDWILASASDDRTVRLWHVRSGKTLRILSGHSDFVMTASFSPDGLVLASGSRGHGRRKPAVRLWDVESGHLLRELEHGEWVNTVTFSPDKKLLAAGSLDGSILLWSVNALLDGDAERTVTARQYHAHDGGVQWVTFSPDGQTLASGGHDHAVRLWDAITGKPREVLAGHTNWVRALAYHPSGQTLASGGWDGTVRLWNSHSGQPERTFFGGTTYVFGIAFSPDSSYVASATSDGIVRLWQADDGRVVRSFTGHTDWVWRVAFHPDGTALASGGMDHSVYLWNDVHRNLTGMSQFGLASPNRLDGDAGVQGLAFSPDGRLLAFGNLAGTLWLTDLAVLQGHKRGRLSVPLEAHAGWCLSVAFSPDGRLLASGGADHQIWLWDVQQVTAQHALQGHDNGVQEVAFSPDGSLLASASWDGSVRLWDVARRQIRHVLQGHTNIAQGVAFSPDGRTLASSSYDGTVRLWNVTDGTAGLVLKGHAAWVFYVAFSPDGRLLASSSGDGTIKLWDPATGECLQTWQMPGPYERMNIWGVTGISEAQRASLLALGAVEEEISEGIPV